MKKLFATVALVTVLATPALAQSWDPDVGSGNIAPAPYGESQNGSSIYQNEGFNARAEAPRHMSRVRHAAKAKTLHKTSMNASDSVYFDGQNVGADPDINVRAELQRDNEETEF
ncbi:hypothetical protein [Rhodoplanes sp. Z2-YC6860]|uniref:hypothetical protein n=1 Tax=Rhodoplanes sp. Z2-YC6860 TaxID=674703 RepID=UPI000829C5DF|nr:hypothetical protein [Rhodoplanes sp. Z2-YC6860]